MSKRNRSWKNVLIDPRYQLRLVLWILVQGAVVSLFYSALLAFLVRSTFAKLIVSTDLAPSVQQALRGNFDSILLQAAAITVAFLLLWAAMGLLFSHRSAGPLYRFRMLFKQVRDGDLSARCNLREGDYHAEAAVLFNEMMDTLEKRVPAEDEESPHLS